MVNAKRKDVQNKEKPEAKKAKVEEEEDSEPEEVEVKGKKGGKVAKAEPKKKAPAKKQQDSDSEEMSEEENGHDEKPKATKGKAADKKGAQKEEKGKKGKEAKKDSKKKKEESEEEEEESEESEEEEKGKKGKKVETPKKETKKPEPKKKAESESEEDDDDDDDDDEEEEEPKKKSEPKKDKKKEESEEEEEEEEEEDKKKDEDSGFVIKSAANASPFGTPKNQNRGGQNFGGARTPGGNEPNTRVFVGNLSFKITDDDIKSFFSDCGNITEIKWMMDRNTGRFRGAGHLEFDSIEASKKAVAKTGQNLLERPISVDFATPMRGGGGGAGGGGGRDKKTYVPREKTPGSRTIFIGGCPDEIQDDDVYEMFGSCGEIEKIRWVTDKNTNKFKGCGFVVFSETDATDKAVALNGTNFKGRTLRIDFADD